MRNMFGEIMWLFVCLARHAWSVQLNNTIARDVYFTISLTFLLLRDLFISFIDTSDAIVLSQKKFVSQKQQCNCPQRVFIPVLGHRIFLHGTRTAKPLNTKKKQAKKLIWSKYVARIVLMEKPHCSMCLKPTVLCPSYLLEMISGCKRSQNTTTTKTHDAALVPLSVSYVGCCQSTSENK